MQTIDLTDYVVRPIPGTWSQNPAYFTPGMLTLVEAGDGVTLAGPLRVRISIHAQNTFNVIGTSVLSVQHRELFGYVLDIPPGQTWTYTGLPFVLRDPVLGTAVAPPATTATANVSLAARTESLPAAATVPPSLAISDVERQVLAAIVRRSVPGFNDRLIVVIRPGGPDACIDPCAPIVDPCKPPKNDCHCGCKPCHCHTHDDDLSCDFAVANTPDISVFFPAACEPCAPGASIGTPPVKGPSLIVPPARGGTVRTRYFNGMFMTSEDLETDQRNVRLKRALMNRALGQGVVWGLNLSLDGDAICVFPGYGVDCCGNDIVITSPYRVDAQALLRDPAAAARLASNRAASFAVVLEYFECPEQPRPVHGDPCEPDTTRCETSRIRETARLRLAPPCEIDDSGPIKDFLAEIEKLKKDPVVGPILSQPVAPHAAGAVAVHVPFTAKIEAIAGTGTDVIIGSATLTPKVGTNPAQDRDRADVVTNADVTRFRITIEAEPGFKFVPPFGVTKVRTMQGPNSVPVEVPLNVLGNDTKFLWTEPFSDLLPLPNASQAEPIPPGFAYQLRNWRMRDTNGNELTAAQTEIQVTPLRRGQWNDTPWGATHPNNVPPNASSLLHVQVLPSDVRGATTPPPIPCFNECDPARPRFPVLPPWLHEDPTRPGRAADPRVLTLALLYSVLALESARTKGGTAGDTTRLQVATAIYNSAWKLFFATIPDTERFRLTEALRRLLRAWCCALLYPGPTCHCEPHGVVIGCAFVSGGQIQSVDPWGGRRWVVHYPLLSYWGQLFGITPLDAIASKIFGLICCIAGLPVPPTTPPTDPAGGGVILGPSAGLGGGNVPSTGRTSEVNLGRALLVLGPPAEAEARIAALGLHPSRVTSVSPIDFVSRFAEAMRFDGDPAATRRPLVHFTVLGLPEFHLVAPGDPEPGPPPPREPGRLRDLVRATIARRTARTAVPSLLKTFAEDLSRNVIGAIPIEPAGPAQTAVATRLADSGITTLGALLGRSAEELHADVLKGEYADGLAALVDRAETDAVAVTKAVADSIVAVATERRLFARADFRAADAATDLGKRIGDRLNALKLKVGATLPDVVVDTAGR